MAARTTLVARVPPFRRPERTWVLGLAAAWLGIEIVEAVDPSAPALPGPPAWTVLRLAGGEDAREVALPELLFSVAGDSWLTTPTSAPLSPLARTTVPPTASGDTSHTSLPVLFGTDVQSSAPWIDHGTRIDVTVDVLGSMFWLLARCEEVISTARDDHLRFPFEASLAASEGFVDRPLADEYAALLGAAISARWPELPHPTAPTPLRLRLTHDIDTPFAAWGRPARVVARSIIGDLVRRHDPVLATARTRAILDARSGRVDRDPLATMDALMDVAERQGLTSQFYFMAGTDPSHADFRYRVDDPPFAAILRRIHERGHDIGLHAGYATADRPEVLRDELQSLKSACRSAGIERESWGVRQHFLRWRWPDTARAHESLGLAHDSTIGFAEVIGFRAGTCHEYQLFDPVERRPMALSERPLIVMDTTLFEYMGLDRGTAAARARDLISRCKPTGGEAVLLVHNDRVAGRRDMGWYRELVAGLVR